MLIMLSDALLPIQAIHICVYLSWYCSFKICFYFNDMVLVPRRNKTNMCKSIDLLILWVACTRFFQKFLPTFWSICWIRSLARSNQLMLVVEVSWMVQKNQEKCVNFQSWFWQSFWLFELGVLRLNHGSNEV